MIPGLAADAALCLQAMKKKAGLFYVMPGANAFLAGLLSDIKETFPKLVEDIENGAVKALILAEADPWRYFSDRKRLQRAFDTLELLIVLDYINSEAAQQAHIFLPATTLFESGGVFINQEGRVQAAPPVLRGGTPIAETGSGDHPPRIYGNGIPGADQKPAWVALAKLVNGKAQSDENKLRKDIWTWLTELLPEFARIPSFNEIPEEGIRLHFNGNDPAQFSLDWTLQPGKRNDQGDNLELIFTDWTYGTEELSGFSPCLRELEREPCLSMHSKDAVALDLINGDDVAIHTDTGNLEVKLCVVENMACRSLILPRHRLLPWQNLGTGRIRICRDKIIKVKSK
jgi:NADH-quinone oxidoreductase subunit G